MKAIIYGRPGCTYCESAKQLCNAKGIPVDYKIVGVDIQKEQLEEMVGKPISTVPQIFFTDHGFSEYIGGFNELSKRVNESLQVKGFGSVLNG